MDVEELVPSHEDFDEIITSGEKRMIHNLYLNYHNRGCDESESIDQAALDLGLPKTLVRKIIHEISKTKCNATYKQLDETQKTTIRRIIHQCYFNNEVPTFHKISIAVQSNETLPLFSKTALKTILKKLDFAWIKRGSKDMLVDKDKIILQRRSYLDKVRKFRREGLKIYYVHVGCVNACLVIPKLWKDMHSEDASGKDKRHIVLHIGSDTGFVEDAHLVFEVNKIGDYRKEIKRDVFENWIRRILPLLEPNSAVVVDTETYNSRKVEKTPLFRWSKEIEFENNRERNVWSKKKLSKWCTKKGITFKEDWAVVQFFDVIRKYLAKNPIPNFVHELVSSTGREVVRLPSYHSELNPIKSVWIQVLEEGLEKVTPERWGECVKLVMKQEDSLYLLDNQIGDVQEIFIEDTNDSDEEVIFGEDSDS